MFKKKCSAPLNKEQRGWRGPAQVKTVNEEEKNITVRIQGRSLDRAPREIRPHVPYLVFGTMLQDDLDAYLTQVMGYCEDLPRGNFVVVGLIMNARGFPQGWQMA